MFEILSSYLRNSGERKDLLIDAERNPSFEFELYPDEVWFEVFLHCDRTSLYNASKVCRLFHSILATPKFWIEKCEQDKVELPPVEWRKFCRREESKVNEESVNKNQYTFNYRSIYHKNPYNRNLAHVIHSDSTIEELSRTHGYVFDHSGDGIIIEKEPVNCEKSSEVEVCFATSYEWCQRYFEIDLRKCGIEDWIMDRVRPTIIVRELSCCRRDCGAVYEFRAQLLQTSELFDKNILLPRFRMISKTWEQWQVDNSLLLLSILGGFSWELSEHIFTEYPPGMRRIGIMSSGKDTQFWAGHYGAKFANTEVIVKFPEDIRLYNDDDFQDPKKEFIGPPHPRRRLHIPIGLRGRFLAHRF
uniref:F-box domain-containing protein n=1 Tax=Heterorhabditis bacteriophora TaxID=37862 RepID=A0A1I7XG51_HETBA